MNSKRVNRLFLTMVLIHLAVVGMMTAFHNVLEMGIVMNFIISELIIAIPAAVFLFCSKGEKAALLPFHKIKITSALMIVLFTYLIMPLTTVLNAISMLFVKNAMVQISGDVISMPFWLMFVMMAVYAPFMEEFVCRGVIYGGYRSSGTKLQAVILSALLFGLMHMNFNQAPYAFVLGIILALLMEATGSIWAPILFHAVFNGHSVVLLFLTKNLFSPELLAESEARTGKEEWIVMLSVYMVIAAVTTAAATCVLAWIARNEGRTESFQAIWRDRGKTEGQMLTGAFVAGVLLCLAYMIFMAVIFGA